MSDSEFVDAPSRHAITSVLDQTLFVEAGAGTGKTSALVGRVMSLLSSQRAELREIVAITFTEAAASELRARIHAALTAMKADPTPAAFVDAALLQLDEAVITTIHGFAHRILSEHPLDAGLPLRFNVLDEIAASLRFERDAAAFLDSFYGEDNDQPDLVSACIAIGVTPQHLRTLLRSCDEARGIASDMEAQSAAIALSELPRTTHLLASSVANELRSLAQFHQHCPALDDGLLMRLAEIERSIAPFDNAADWLDELAWLLSLREQRVRTRGRKTNWTGCDIGEVRDAISAADSVRESACNDLVDATLFHLSHVLEFAVREWASRRRVDGELTFHDLLITTHALVAENASIRASLRHRYPRILIDEFQDTDPLQLAIMLALGRDGDAADLVPGALFFVGDPRQSIYRFRGARPELYEDDNRAQLSSQTMRLSTNFRSVPGVVAFVNAVFPEMARQDVTNPLDGVPELWVNEHVLLDPARSSTAGGPPVTLLGGPLDGPVGERRTQESEDVAAAIANVIEHATLNDESTGPRAVKYRDVAILVPRRTGLSELEDALYRHGIPYQLESASLIYNASEVEDLLACLRTLAFPGDETCLLAALRTPMFACGDDELLAYRRAGGEWRLDVKTPVQLVDHKVSAAIAYLQSLSARSHELGLVGTVQTFIAERYVLELSVARRHPREALRRVRFVQDQVRSFAASGGASFAELLSFMDLQRSLSVRVVEATSTTVDDDAVHIMTIHGAKGLEFPVVVLAELGGTGRDGGAHTAVLRDHMGRLELRAGAGRETKGYAVLASGEARADRDERLRLCYVAATRARDHLVISTYHRPAGSADGRSLAELITLAAASCKDLWQRRVDETPRLFGIDQTSRTRSGGNAEPYLSTSAEYATLLRERALFAAGLALRTSIAASELSEVVSTPTEGSDITSTMAKRTSTRRRRHDDAGDMLARQEAASALGRATHAVLQLLPYAYADVIDAVIHQCAMDEAIVDQQDTIRSLVLAARSAPTIDAALQAARSWRELPVTAVIANRLLEAVIDLCYVKDGSLVIVDYKTDALQHPKDAATAAQRYRLQAGAYALALSQVTQMAVDKVTLVFLSLPTGAIEVDVPDLAGAMASAQAVLASSVTPIGSPRTKEAI